MEINPETIRRLAFIKYFFQFAREQSKLPSPQNYLSILMFHDSVELFLHLSAESLGANLTKNSFMEYFTKINKELKGIELSQKTSMDKLNRARVSLKHKGLYPNPDDIDYFRVSTQAFFEENCPIVFGIEFTDISLLNLIQDEEVRKDLENAQKEFENGHYKESLEIIAIAFHILLENYEKNKKIYELSPFRIGMDLDREMRLESSTYGYTDNRPSYYLIKTVQKIQEVLKIILLNLDYRKYLKFRLLTPDNVIYAKGVKFSTMWLSGRDKMDFKREDVEYCIDFIIESALKLQEFDFEIDKKYFLYSLFI